MLSVAMLNAVEGANAAVATAGEVVAKVDRAASEDGLTHLREASDQVVRDDESRVVALSKDAKRTDSSPSTPIASIKRNRRKQSNCSRSNQLSQLSKTNVLPPPGNQKL